MSSVPLASAQDVSSPSGSMAGLTTQEAEARLSRFGPNDPASTRRGALAFELLHLFLNPLVIILLVASVISAFLGEKIEAELIFVIVLFSVTIDFVQTYRSQRAIQRLQEHVSLTATALRDGQWQEIKRQKIVPCDIVRLSAGDLKSPPTDSSLKHGDLYVQQAALTGESMPAEKEVDIGAPVQAQIPTEEKSPSGTRPCISGNLGSERNRRCSHARHRPSHRIRSYRRETGRPAGGNELSARPAALRFTITRTVFSRCCSFLPYVSPCTRTHSSPSFLP